METIFCNSEWLLLKPQNKSYKRETWNRKEIFFPRLERSDLAIWGWQTLGWQPWRVKVSLPSGNQHLEGDLSSQKGQGASLLQAGGTGLGRVHQRGPTGDHELRDLIGRLGLCVNGKAPASPLMKKDGELPWTPITHLNVLRNGNWMEVLGNVYIPKTG